MESLFSVRTVAAVLLFPILLGCQSRYEITRKPDGAEAFKGLARAVQVPAPMGVLNVVKVSFNDTERRTSKDLQVRLRDKLRESNLFYEIVGERPLPSTPHILLDFSLAESNDINRVTMPLKLLLTLFTFGLISHSVSYDLNLSLLATRSDGAEKTYTSRSSGTATFRSFHPIDREGAWDDLTSTVFNLSMNGLMAQMVQDAGFYRSQFRTYEPER